ncbi:hypothetical protein ACFQH3_11695 [Haladaptatus sp. GCM10025707]|uniref:hypothetical protein n=1 Tax=unclassified Haladaptatus TaxID=2622732 RepID=UPI0023E850A2|nr:hypothetical protein [Haladaptatus sp. QDMS2]
MDRREYMELLAAGGALGVAGCTSAEQGPTTEPPSDDIPPLTTADRASQEDPTTETPTSEATTKTQTTQEPTESEPGTTAEQPTETEAEPTTQEPAETTQQPTTEEPTQTTETATQEQTTQEQTTQQSTTTEEPTTTTQEPTTTEESTTTTEEPTETPTETAQEPTTEEPTETTTEEPTGQATFELVAFDAPEEVDMGTAFTYSFTVENTGDATGEFETEVNTKVDYWFDWPTKPFQWAVTLGPGEQATFQSEEIKGWWDAPYTIRIEALDEERQIRFTRPVLAFGESFELWDGKRITIDIDVGDQTSYFVPVFDYDAIALDKKDSANTFVHAWISMEDISGEIWQFVLGSNGDWYSANYGRHPGFYPYLPDDHDTREGWLTFEASSSFDPDDVTVGWQDEDAIAMIGAYWTNNPAGVP